MRILGIDYGSKKIGLAVSDETEKFAFPLAVLKNDAKIFAQIGEIIKKKNIQKIVLGLPLTLDNKETKDTQRARDFKLKLENITGLPVVFEQEFFTTKEAERIQGKHRKIDASAAALILENYLSKIKN